MTKRIVATALVVLGCLSTSALAQFQEGSKKGVQMGAAGVQKWQAGMTVKAVGGPCTGIIGYVPIPREWPEQSVQIANEEVTPNTKIDYETIEGGAKIMSIKMPRIGPNEEAKGIITFEIRRHALLAPKNTSIFEMPDTKKLPRDVRVWLGPSPLIEVKSPKIKSILKDIPEKEKAWQQVEAVYDYVREKVEYKKQPVKGALAALRDGNGGDEDQTSLFIAICRTMDIPARTVWVHGHCYPEFYLADDDGEGHWIPCEVGTTRCFGSMQDTRPILQKGDNFRPPFNRKERQRYLAEYLTGAGGQPKCHFIRQPVGQ